jgi:SAM-dependent methyltransferase
MIRACPRRYPAGCEVFHVIRTRKPESNYALGHGSAELDRLIMQSSYIGDLSDRFLRLAGLKPGMHVLDVGCGAGDLSFLAARLVGPKGHVLGIDRSPESIAVASNRAARAGLTNVQFIEDDAAAFSAGRSFDAIVGRLVMMYWPEAPVVLKHLARLLAPGGLITFQEYDLEAMRSEPPCALFDAAVDRVLETFRRVGAETQMGLKMGQVFEAAGLRPPQMLLSGRVERGADAGVFRQVSEVTRTLLPAIERTGVATAAEGDVDTLEERMRAEAVAMDATLVAPPLVAAWTTAPVAEPEGPGVDAPSQAASRRPTSTVTSSRRRV